MTTPGGTTNAVPFYYILPPRILALDPASGPVSGGTVATITGRNLFTADAVTFGSTTVTPVVLSDTEIFVSTPPGTPGSVPVVVTTRGGVADGAVFTYVGLPTVTGFTPAGDQPPEATWSPSPEPISPPRPTSPSARSRRPRSSSRTRCSASSPRRARRA